MYIYNDEDNAPMSDEAWDRIDKDGHNPTTYLSYEEMRAADRGEVPFEDGPDNGCWNCIEYDGNRCRKEWNNNDPVYYIPERDDKAPDDHCEYWDLDKDAVWEDYFEED